MTRPDLGAGLQVAGEIGEKRHTVTGGFSIYNLTTPDVAFVQVSPPDEHGFMSFGVETMAARAACNNAKKVIVQVNERMPRVLGDSFIHVNRVDAIHEHREDLPQLKPREISEVEQKIADGIRGLITDGSTIQISGTAGPAGVRYAGRARITATGGECGTMGDYVFARGCDEAVVLIAGKGHDTYQQIGSRRLPFDDAAIAREELGGAPA